MGVWPQLELPAWKPPRKEQAGGKTTGSGPVAFGY